MSQDLLVPGCYASHTRLPFRLAVAADQHAEFQKSMELPEAARELGKTWLIHFEDPGKAPHPVIFTAVEQPRLPRAQASRGMASGKPAKPARGTAVLFAGDWRFDEGVVASIQRHLVRPLKAKVFAVVSRRGQRHGWVERRSMKKLLPSLAAFAWEIDDSAEDLRGKIRPRLVGLCICCST